MNQPLIHPTTKVTIDSYINKPSHSLLLVGPDGVGKYHIARWLVDELELDEVTVTVLDDKKLISIEQIQQLYTQTRTGSRLAIIIKDAHKMSTDAQNAFLKLLEEPPENTFFILTARSLDHVLQTIRSRCQIISLVPPSGEVMLAHLIDDESHDVPSEQLKPLLVTTGGRIGTVYQLLQDDESRTTHLALAAEAKGFYGASPYERLTLLQQHNFDRDWSVALLDILAIIIETLLQQPNADSRRLSTLQKQAEAVESAASALAVNGSPKAHMTRLAVAL